MNRSGFLSLVRTIINGVGYPWLWRLFYDFLMPF
jgi:hypothetical protein